MKYWFLLDTTFCLLKDKPKKGPWGGKSGLVQKNPAASTAAKDCKLCEAFFWRDWKKHIIFISFLPFPFFIFFINLFLQENPKAEKAEDCKLWDNWTRCFCAEKHASYCAEKHWHDYVHSLIFVFYLAFRRSKWWQQGRKLLRQSQWPSDPASLSEMFLHDKIEIFLSASPKNVQEEGWSGPWWPIGSRRKKKKSQEEGWWSQREERWWQKRWKGQLPCSNCYFHVTGLATGIQSIYNWNSFFQTFFIEIIIFHFLKNTKSKWSSS